MRLATLTLFFTLFAAGISAQTAPSTCGPYGKSSLRTTLYFGTKHPTGSVTKEQWRKFLKTEVTPRFPAGFTVWEANGQWRNPAGTILREKSKVLVVVTPIPDNDDSPTLPATVSAIISSYKKQFDQQSVMWETARVCASF